MKELIWKNDSERINTKGEGEECINVPIVMVI